MIRCLRFSPTIYQSVPLPEMVAFVQLDAAGSASETSHVVHQLASAHHHFRGGDTSATSGASGHREQSAIRKFGNQRINLCRINLGAILIRLISREFLNFLVKRARQSCLRAVRIKTSRFESLQSWKCKFPNSRRTIFTAVIIDYYDVGANAASSIIITLKFVRDLKVRRRIFSNVYRSAKFFLTLPAFRICIRKIYMRERERYACLGF